MTVADLISSALRLIGVLAAGELVSPDDAATALPVLQDMIDGWNADGLAVFTTTSNDFPLVGGKQAYTLGAGGDFNIPRPPAISGMSAILLDNPLNPIEVPMDLYSVDDWQTKVPVKNVSSTFPQICYDTGDYPLRTLNMWPYPNSSQNKVRIYSWQPLSSPTNFATTIAFPPGYNEAFRFNLALRLAAEYGVNPPPVIALGATESMARVKRMNLPDLEMRSDLTSSPDDYSWSADMFGNPYQ